MSAGRILAIDDDRFFREFYKDILGKHDYLVDTAADGKGCLALLAENAYDLVILDLILEDTDGLTLAEQIRRENAGLEIVMATKVDDLASINKALSLGIKEYIIKPIHERELVQTVGDVLERQRIFLEHGRLLSETAEYFYTLSIYKRGLAILATLELDLLVEAMLEAFMEETNAAGAILWLAVGGQQGEFREITRRGVVDAEEVSHFVYSEYRQQDQLVGEHPFFPQRPDEEAGVLDRSAIHIPLIRHKELLGIAKLVRGVGGDFRPKDLRTLRMLGEFSAVALQNALVVQDLKRRSVRGDHILLSSERFMDIVERERLNAIRYSRSFSLIEANLPLEGADAESLLAAQLRETDAVTEMSPGCYRFFLPETDGLGARTFSRRIMSELGTRNRSGSWEQAPVHAAFPLDGEDMDSLIGALRRRQETCRVSRAQSLSPESFWSHFEHLVHDTPGSALQTSGMDKNGFLDVAHFLFTELASHTHGAALFLGLPDLGRHKAWLEERLFMAGRRTRICLFGDTSQIQLPENLDNVMAIHVPPNVSVERHFALYLGDEDGLVALYERGTGDDAPGHASFVERDEFLADRLIMALQEQYFLQRQL